MKIQIANLKVDWNTWDQDLLPNPRSYEAINSFVTSDDGILVQSSVK